MRFREQYESGVTVIYAEGDLVVSAVPCALQSVVKTALARGERQIVLNLAGITRMDSACLAELVASYTSAKASGGVLKLSAVTSDVRRLLELTRLDTMIKMFATDDEAIADFKNEASAI